MDIRLRNPISAWPRVITRQVMHIALTIFIVLPAIVFPGAVVPQVEEVSFRQVVTTPSGTALGGAVDLTLRSDGTYKAHFHMHDSGAVDYKFVVRAVFAASNGTAFALQHSGEVEGLESTSLTSGPRRDSDKDIDGFHPFIKSNWGAVKAGKMSVSKDYSKAGVIGFIEDLSKIVADITKGAARGAVGAVIGLGDEMVQAFKSLELTGTVGIIAGVAVMASGGGIVLAVTTGVQAGLVTAALIKQRPVTAQEMQFADAVFKGTLPPGQNIILTNLEGLGGRAFTIPGPNSKVYVNIGSYGYDHPLTHLRSDKDSPGRLFIHELTHVWQIHHRTFVPGWVCDGLIAQAGNTFGNAYEYESEGFKPWSNFSIEQQGAIVDDWFARMEQRKKDGMDPEDSSDSYFRYIRDDIREGKKIAAAPATLYQLHVDGKVFKYDNFGRCAPRGACPGWAEIDHNPRTKEIVTANGTLFQLHVDGKIFKYDGDGLCDTAGCAGWTEIDHNTRTASIAGGSGGFYQLHVDGRMFKYDGRGQCSTTACPGWTEIDRNPRTKSIVPVGSTLFQLHVDGKMFKYDGSGQCTATACPGWVEIDHNTRTASIVGSSDGLYQIHVDGKIFKYDFRGQCTTVGCLGWTEIDHNPRTKEIVTANGTLSQLHVDGKIFKYDGNGQCTAAVCPGWVEIDHNPSTAAITGSAKGLYQFQVDGKIFKYDGNGQCNMAACPGWVEIDHNPRTKKIVARN
jgi:hypothetical protein